MNIYFCNNFDALFLLLCRDRGIVCHARLQLTTFDNCCDKVNLCHDILYLPCVADFFMCFHDKVLKCPNKLSMNSDMLV